MASAVFLVKLSPASTRARLNADGSAVVSSATHDMGTGTYTSLAQVAAEELQMPLERVRFELGDTNFPAAPASAGSQTSASVGSAVVLAVREAVRHLIALAVHTPESPLYRVDPSRVILVGPDLVCADQTTRRIPWAQLLKQTAPVREFLEAECTWTPPGKDERDWSGWSFGAHFCEVEVDEDLGYVRVRRWVGAFAAGRILNEKTARSQLSGAIVWGISQALLERTIHDDHSGHIVNPNLAEYLIPVHADIPSIHIDLIAERDPSVNPLGAKGLGELGICGASAAVANAVYHATGRRFRSLPITVDRFLEH
jgi:xanthine dehydrogenase YagR molybdenum-binding subunit